MAFGDEERPLLLDLFCGAGGAAQGYADAGFDVVGVDLHPQPRFPFAFVQGDALDVLDALIAAGGTWQGRRVAAVHASPPCQGYTAMSNRWRGEGSVADAHPKLIAPVRERLERLGVPFVIENVPGAKRHLRAPIKLHGGMFGLGTVRPRLFECVPALDAPPPAPQPVFHVGVYGKHPDGRLLWRRRDGTELRAPRGVEEGRRAMGVAWMEWRELAESIPPAYTRHLGAQLRAMLTGGPDGVR